MSHNDGRNDPCSLADLVPTQVLNSAPYKMHSGHRFGAQFSRPLFLFFNPPQAQNNSADITEHHHQDVLNNSLPQGLVHPPVVKIPPSTSFDNFVTHPTQFSVPRELNSSYLLVQDASVVNTDSQQSPWLPSSSTSLPAPPAHQPQSHQSPHQPPQQDFVLYPPPPQQPHNRTVNAPQRHTRQITNNSNRLSTSRSLTQEEARHLAAHRRFLLQQHHAKASASAPPSLHQSPQQPAIYTPDHRPPVPLFSATKPQSTKNNMELGNNPLAPPHTSFFPQQNTVGSHTHSDIDLPEFTPFEGGSAPAADFPVAGDDMYNFDLSSSIGSSHLNTVSPDALFLGENQLSAPGSAAYTAFTTPSMDGSPAFTEWESPLIAGNDVDHGSWFSLFPDASGTNKPAAPAPVDQSPATQSEDLEATEAPSQPRKKSSASSSPSGRHSSVSGVSARRRGKPLPPITVSDPSDVVSMKRAKNTLAARKSRARKAERMDDLELQVRELMDRVKSVEAERDQWKQLAISHGAADQ